LSAASLGGIALILALLASPAFAQAPPLGSSSGMIGGGGAGALTAPREGMIGGPAASAGTRGTGVIRLRNQPRNPTPPPPVGAGYGTPGNVGNFGQGNNFGTGAGVEHDIRTGVPTSPNVPLPWSR
jgi:hypothetical protein